MRPALNIGLAGLLLAVVVLAPFPGNTRLMRALHDSAHAPIFGLIAVVVLTTMRSHRRTGAWTPAAQCAATLMVVLLLGLATELMQLRIGRDASLHDVRNDVLGGVAFLAIFAAFAGGSMRLAPQPVLLGIATAALAFATLPVLRGAVELVRREAQFPLIADFGRRMDRHFVGEQWAVIEHALLPAPWSTSEGERALHVVFQRGPWPGLDFYEPSADWSGYSSLLLDLVNPTDSMLTVSVRVHDHAHNHNFEDRFNARYDIPARTRVVLGIPLAQIRDAPTGRRMNMEEIAGLILFRAESSAAGEMYLSKVWLQ